MSMFPVNMTYICYQESVDKPLKKHRILAELNYPLLQKTKKRILGSFS